MSRFRYEGERLREARFPMGGIGAGCVSIDGGARLVDWEILNRPNKESYNGFSHLAVKAERDGKLLDARALNGPYGQGRMGKGLHPFGGYSYGPAREAMVGVPHFRGVALEGTFPIATYRFEGDFPGKVVLRAWSPFEPVNDFDSSLPLALFEVEITNPTEEEIAYSTAFTLCNPVRDYPVNSLLSTGEYRGLLCDSGREDKGDPRWGQACLLTCATDVSAQQNWFRGSWFDNLNVFWQDFATPGPLKPRSLTGYPEEGNVTFEASDHGTVSVRMEAAPGQTVRTRFALGWYFPHWEKYWGNGEGKTPPVLRNWYASQFSGAEEVAAYGLAHWDRMEEAARTFAEGLYGSSLPEEVTDAAGSTLAVLKSPTCLRLADGSFYAWEGSHARDGSCEGSCQHVWNYQYALPMLFPALERSMRELDYRYNLKPDGATAFRLQLPLGAPPSGFRACADGQMGGIVKSYREWKISGDTSWLKSLWPSIKKSLEFAWSPRNPDRWDPGEEGVLTGRQHHTLDMELFGPNSWLSGLYLAALEAAARMADAVGDGAFGDKCRRIKERGMETVDKTLFNGEYFYHRVNLEDRSVLEEFAGTGDGVVESYWNGEAGEIKYQIGEGSSIDQLYGQWHADLLGLGDVFDREKTQTALGSLYRYNYVESMEDFFNPCRIYCMEEEGGLLICAYPQGARRPVISAPYAEETMHGFEYAAACHMILRGLEQEGLACVRALRDRYNGALRNPWNEIECGGNYARSMAAWSLVMAYQGLRFDMTEGRIGFSPLHPEDHRSLWSLSTAWGLVTHRKEGMILRVSGGSIALKQVDCPALHPTRVLVNGQEVPFAREGTAVVFPSSRTLVLGDMVEIQ